MKKEIICSALVPRPVGPYSQAVKADNMLYCSGQLPLKLDGSIPEGIEAQTRQVLANLKAVLDAGGTHFGNVVKTTVFLNDMNDFPVVNAIYAEAFGETAAPARSTVQVARLPKDVLVEMDAIALI